ncbi:cytidine deaminase [Methylobacterium nigriterrae]|uniref:cytidine deaminase n=1 Tax=Methylobacterium nigriterrae TaxID=3127512 RepID=UPI003013E53C
MQLAPNETNAGPARGDAPERSLVALFEAAQAVRARAHAPYSNFRVGAALRDDRGRIHAGCNVENAAYPAGTCAEAGAIAAMVAAGGRAIREILVLGDGEGLVTPCGACRQRIREFAAGATAIHVAGPEGLRRSFTLESLLPHSFGPETLGGDA